MEENCSGARKRSGPKDNFTDILFSWSLQEIFDEDLYKYQVENIPKVFGSVDQYLSSYVYPLLEETRSAIASSLETVYKAPFAEVVSFSEVKPADTFLYDVKIDSWKNKISDRGKEPYRTLPGDLVLLSDSKPESVSDLLRVGWTYTFGSVRTISDDERGDKCTASDFRLRTSVVLEVGDQRNKSLYVIYMTNMTTQRRIWNALRMRQNLKIIEKVLVKNDQVEENCEFCPQSIHRDIEEKYRSTLLAKLNESQLGAVMASIRKIGCSHESSVELIWGPPGTGKTSTLSTLLYILLRMNVRTLICAPTNTAITELASRVTALVRNADKADGGKSFLTRSLGGMLLFGNNDRLKVGSDIQEIFLEYRVDRLMEILVPLTGWRHCFSSMIDFLENCVSQHQIYVENEQMNSKEHSDGESALHGIKSILDFARDRFKNLAPPLRDCMLTIVTHLPRSIIDEGNCESIEKLFSLLDSLEKLVYEEGGMTSQKLTTIFMQPIMTGSEIVIDATSLHYIRSHCLFILRSLQSSLSNLKFPIVASKSLTEEFCFQKASLIFCTISSAYKLHSVDIEPFQSLVIDEAAQVKECESTIAFQIKDVGHAILVGDECQLPATVSSKLSEEAGFGRSLFERLSSMGHPKHLLDVQYRMHPSISRFPNSKFYQNQILDALNVQSKSYERSYLQGTMFGPYSFINVRGGREELDDVGVSRRNMVEVAVIVKLVQKLYKAWNSSNEKLSIGVISPYAAQVAAIHNKLQSRYDNLKKFTVKVKSIDGFQGGEEDIIIMSTVRSHKGGSIGFLCSPQRTNVALTRARHCLWILGNERTLIKSDSVWEAIVTDAKDRQCFFHADEDSEIGKVIVEVKKELNQLDDLLSGDSTLFQNLRWQVLFSDDFRKSFHKLRFSSTKKLVINLLLRLARGWRPRKVIVDWKCENSSYILKQFKVDIYYVVCSIDLMKDSVYKQVLKVWDILPMTDTAKLLKRIDTIASMYTDDFINHCNDKLFERNLEVPRSWSLATDVSRFKNQSNSKSNSSASNSVESRSYVENSKVSESLLLMKFYSLSCGTVNHLLSDVEGNEIDLPFEVTDEEREIINFPRSSFILGRSGTGKTTILTTKLYQKFQQYCIASRDSVSAEDIGSASDEDDVEPYNVEFKSPVLHQLFVTVSPKLCHAIKKNVSQMKSIATENSGQDNFIGMEDVDEMSEFKDIPDSFVGISQEKYPLIVTFHKFLMMLDGTLGESYFRRFPCARDYSYYEGSRRSVALQTFLRKNEVTYDRFVSAYWPHFNTKLTKSLDSSRVFTEIMSHIKGGPLEGEVCQYKRSRQDYISLSKSRVSTLCEEQRHTIYDIFEDYEKLKLELGDFDLADFVSDVHRRLKEEDLPGDKMDFVYIDEVQDLTMRHISLFKYICKNIDEGFIFSGDTAQTIARGIDFRFEDIRSLFYNEFLMRSIGCDSSDKREKGLITDIFYLSHNFRTHTGVLRLAQSVVDLICYYFPHSIDVLAPETSRIYGESPIFLEPGSDDNLIISIFGHSGKSSGKWVGFGADQVILVRDNSAKEEISEYIGHQALILTIVECKGLEFQDVLLYNFFGSSPLTNQWRVLYEYLKEKDLLDSDSSESFPSFSQSRHNVLCSELKQLYVAITRTKQRLWICENNVEASKPMLDYWRRLSLVQVRKIDDSLALAMQRASTPEEWKSQGQKLFWEKNYEMATMCFERAGDETLEKMAKASGLKASAESVRLSNCEEATSMLREAAEMFDSINRAESAAECFYDLTDYERAGRIYRDKTSDLGKAGECFSLAGKIELAAEVYASGKFFRECLAVCSKGSHFELGLQYIEKWKQQALSNSVVMARFKEIDGIVQEYLENCAMKCYLAGNKASMMKFVRAFHSLDSKRNFLKSKDCLEERLVLEEELGNFNEASTIAKSLGDALREAVLLEKAGQFSVACSLMISYVTSKVLWGSGNRGWPLKSFPQKVELLRTAMSAAQKVSGSFYASVCAQANFLLYDQKNLSELSKFYNSSKQYETPVVEILVVRKLLDVHFETNTTKYEWDHDMQLESTSFDKRIARNQVSGGSLVYLWNLWRKHSEVILECLDSLENTDSVELEGIVGFCFDYFGLRLPENSGVTVHLLNPDAAWVKAVEGFIRMKGKVATLEARHFAAAARRFWLQELLLVGLQVLNALQYLHRSSIAKRMPLYCQSMCLLHVFDIAKFFLDLKSIKINYSDNRKLQDYVQLCIQYFDFVFPKDPRGSLCEKMLSLRETTLSRNLLEENAFRNISGRKELSSGQIGRAVMTIMGSGKLKHGFYDKVAERLSNNLNCKLLIANLMEIVESNSVKESKSVAVPNSREVLSQLLHRALAEVYSIHWRECDYISPHCFLYLIERMLILAPHPRDFFFTTKSSFVEYLVSLPLDANPRASLVTHNKSHPESMIYFVLQVVEGILNDGISTGEWIKRSGLNYKFYYPVLVLRLLMLLCVLCINWDLSLDIFNQKMSRFGFTSGLPRPFCDALRPRRRGYIQFISAVATAFKLIGDPLVIVVSDDINRNFPYPDAVILDLRSFSSKTDVMRTLFPRSTEAARDHPATVERNMTKSSSVEGKNTIVESSEDTSKTAPKSRLENENLQINWNLIGAISAAESENLKSLLLRKKVEMREHISSIINYTASRLIQQRSHSGEENDFLRDGSHLLGNLNTLLSSINTSEYNSKETAVICDLCKSMEERRPQIEELLSCLARKNVANVVVSEKDKEKESEINAGDEEKESEINAGDEKKASHFNAEDEEKESDFTAEDEESKIEDSAVVEVESNPSNKKMKPKQGKGGAVVSEEDDEENDDAEFSDSNVEEDRKTVANTSKKGKGKNKKKNKSKKGKGKRK